MSLWSMILKGGWLMLPIFALSVWAVYIFFDKFLKIKKSLHNGMDIDEEIKEIARRMEDGESIASTPINNVILKGLEFSSLPAGEMREIIENKANEETSIMEKSLPRINTCATLAPMIGFLGTVIGMIQAFYDMAQAGNNVNVELLSRGIYTALITTVAGLLVGITAHILGDFLAAAIDSVVERMERICNRFVENKYKE